MPNEPKPEASFEEVMAKQHEWDSGTCEADMRPIYDKLCRLGPDIPHHLTIAGAANHDPKICPACRFDAILHGPAK